MSAVTPHVTPIPAFTDNYIWSIEWPDGSCVIVDPGAAEPVLTYMNAENRSIRAILITHHHSDHVGGVARLLQEFNVPVYGPANTRFQGITHPLQEGDLLPLNGLTFRILEVPGHTLDHIAYVTESDSPILFCGDTLFAGGCGRLFEGTPAIMLRSLMKLAALPPQTRVYCAHEYTLSNLLFAATIEPQNQPLNRRIDVTKASRQRQEPTLPSTLSLELSTNPFLRCETAAVIAAARRLDPSANDATTVFAALRELKNRF